MTRKKDRPIDFTEPILRVTTRGGSRVYLILSVIPGGAVPVMYMIEEGQRIKGESVLWFPDLEPRVRAALESAVAYRRPRKDRKKIVRR